MEPHTATIPRIKKVNLFLMIGMLPKKYPATVPIATQRTAVNLKQEPAVPHPSRSEGKGRMCRSALARNAVKRIVFPPCLSNRCVEHQVLPFHRPRGLAVILSPKKCPIQ